MEPLVRAASAMDMLGSGKQEAGELMANLAETDGQTWQTHHEQRMLHSGAAGEHGQRRHGNAQAAGDSTWNEIG